MVTRTESYYYSDMDLIFVSLSLSLSRIPSEVQCPQSHAVRVVYLARWLAGSELAPFLPPPPFCGDVDILGMSRVHLLPSYMQERAAGTAYGTPAK